MGTKLRDFFLEADTSGDGLLSYDELHTIIADPAMKAYLAFLDLRPQDVETLFQLLEDGDRDIPLDKFQQGCTQLKGHARAADVVAILHKTQDLEALCHETRETCEALSHALLPAAAQGNRRPSRRVRRGRSTQRRTEVTR